MDCIYRTTIVYSQGTPYFILRVDAFRAIRYNKRKEYFTAGGAEDEKL